MSSVIYKNSSSYFFAFFILITFSSNTLAQAEIFGFVGYEFASDVQVTQGQLNIYSNPNYNAGIAFEVERGIQAEVFWIGQQTTMELKSYTGLTEPLVDHWINYFQVNFKDVHFVKLGKYFLNKNYRKSFYYEKVHHIIIRTKLICKCAGSSLLGSSSWRTYGVIRRNSCWWS